MLSVDKRSTGSTVAIEVVTNTREGESRLSQQLMLFVRETESVGKPRRPRSFSLEPVHVANVKISGDQTFRYAKASFTEGIRPHEDHEYARLHGYRTYFLAGQNTMALVAKSVVDNLAGGDPMRLLRLKVRFAQVVYPFDVLTTRIWANGALGGYSFETTKADGTAVLVNGIVDIRV